MKKQSMSNSNESKSSISEIGSSLRKVKYKFEANQVEDQNSIQETQFRKTPRQRDGEGRSTNIVPNIFKALMKSKKKLKKEFFIFQTNDRPKEWTKKAELVLLFLTYHEANRQDKDIFIEEITRILRKMIQFQKGRLQKQERANFHQINIHLLQKIQQICLNLLNRATIPNRNQIGQILKRLISFNNENSGSIVVQAAKIKQAHEYILRQFPIYSNQNQQERGRGIQPTNSIMLADIATSPSQSLNEGTLHFLQEQNFENKYNSIFRLTNANRPETTHAQSATSNQVCCMKQQNEQTNARPAVRETNINPLTNPMQQTIDVRVNARIDEQLQWQDCSSGQLRMIDYNQSTYPCLSPDLFDQMIRTDSNSQSKMSNPRFLS